MKKLAILGVCLSFFLFFTAAPVAAITYYHTWEVIEVTKDTIVIQREGEGDKVTLEKSRRPYLKVGDRVRYDHVRNRLGNTLEK